ncbi:hypothetical protein LCGC14_2242550, partial [marine sediment metagenome]
PYDFGDRFELKTAAENIADFNSKLGEALENQAQESQMRKFDTENYHGHPKFYELLQQMADLHGRKNHDYAGDDPLSNLRASEEIGIPAWKGILVRLMDKWSRLKNFARTGIFEVKDESLIDALMDNAVYSLLCIILFEEEKEKLPDGVIPDSTLVPMSNFEEPRK